MPLAREQIVAQVRNGLLRPGPDPTYADGDDSSWMQVEWPPLTHRVPILGRQVNVVDTGAPAAGDGVPVLFIHGLGGNWQNWLLNIPAFMATHRCVALDLPGFGDSELPAEDLSIRGYARVVDALCAELGVERVAMVGNSMGGFIGAEVALSFPTRVEKLVLVSAAGLAIQNQRPEPLLTLARMSAATRRIWTTQRETVVRRPLLRRAAFQGAVRYPERLSAALTWELIQGTGKEGFVPALEALMSYSFRDRLGEIEAPTLIVWGRNDMLVPVSDADEYEQLIGPNARKVVFDDTGHAPMIERPSRFNELVAEFLAGSRTPEADVTGVSRN